MKRARISDEDLRLECARLVSVFTAGKGDQVALTARLFQFIREGRQ